MSSEKDLLSKETVVFKEARAPYINIVLKNILTLNVALKQDKEDNFILEKNDHSNKASPELPTNVLGRIVHVLSMKKPST